MKVCGLLGLGKLGLPVAVALATKTKVIGYDTNPKLCLHRTYEHKEEGFTKGSNFQEVFDQSTLEFAPSLEALVKSVDILFVAIQTPHQPEFDGSKLLPGNRREDFNYAYLINACIQIAPYVRKEQTVAIISTMLPGTMTREIVPILGDKCKLVYNPFFIAMGTVLQDFMNPEFVLLGGDMGKNWDLHIFYHHFYAKNPNEYIESVDIPIRRMSYESAELTKVAYNLFISEKTTYINTLGEISHKIPECNVDDVSDVLSLATNRLLSKKYLRSGLVDSGPCHPRDAIAMSWLAHQLHLSCDPFEQVSQARERQSEWLVDLFLKKAGSLPLVLLGKAFKPESNLTNGSAALLIADILTQKGKNFAHHDPLVDNPDNTESCLRGGPKAYLITCKHEQFKQLVFPAGSVVVDPFRYLPPQGSQIRLVQVGVGLHKENE